MIEFYDPERAQKLRAAALDAAEKATHAIQAVFFAESFLQNIGAPSEIDSAAVHRQMDEPLAEYAAAYTAWTDEIHKPVRPLRVSA